MSLPIRLLFISILVFSLFTVGFFSIPAKSSQDDLRSGTKESTPPINIYVPIITRCTVPAQPFLNGDFEGGHWAWTEYLVGSFDPRIITQATNAHSGSWLASLVSGSWPGADTYIEQTVTIPDCSPYLSFWVYYDPGEGLCGTRCGSGGVLINGVDIAGFDGGSQTWAKWFKVVVDLRNFAGQTVAVRIQAGASQRGVFFSIDDVGFQSDP